MTYKLSLLNLALRGVTLASKFVLLIVMAHHLSPAQVGVFGLLSTTIAYALFFLGLDFYVFNTRELLARLPGDHARLLRDQLVLHMVTWLVFLPAFGLVFSFRLLPVAFWGWFYILLILEHLSQEAYRLFTTLSRPVLANLLLFLRSGAWAYAVIAVLLLSPGHRNLTPVLLGWSVGVLGSLLLAAWALRSLGWREAFSQSVDWRWIRTGTAQSLLFLSATLALKGMEFSDRYFIQHYMGEAMVGVYMFYTSITGVIQTCIYAGVISILYPHIVAAHQSGRLAEYHTLMRKLSIGTLVGVMLATAFFALAIGPIVSLVGKPIYASHLAVFRVLLLSSTLLTVSYIPHYGLYAQRHDRMLIASAFVGLIVAIALNGLLVPHYGIMGAAIANTTAVAAVGGLKTLSMHKARKS